MELESINTQILRDFFLKQCWSVVAILVLQELINNRHSTGLYSILILYKKPFI